MFNLQAIRNVAFLSVIVLSHTVLANSYSDRIKTCLAALYQDQKDFHKRNGRFAAHVNQLHHSEREACYGMVLRLNRKTGQDFRISAEIGEQSGSINNKKIIEMSETTQE